MNPRNDFEIMNPTKKEDLELIKAFNDDIYKRLKQNIKRKTLPEEKAVITEKYYATIKEEKIVNFLIIKEEKDTKTASIYPMITVYKKNLIPNLTDYLINNEDMEEVFVFVEEKDKRTQKHLIENDFISLSTKEDTKYIPLVKEKEREEERRVSWNY